MHRFLLALALLAPGLAWADPFSAVGLLAAYGTATAGTVGFLGLSAATWFYVGVAASACGAANGRRKARRLEAKA